MHLSDYYFRSDLFQVEPGETEDPNPPLHGKQLAHWLAEKLGARGYQAPDVIPEDWGWCVMCRRTPFFLWVGCGGTLEEGAPRDEAALVPARDILWHCFAQAEVPFWRRLWGRLDVRPELETLAGHLEAILRAEPAIRLVEAP